MAIIPIALSGEQKKANNFFNNLSKTKNINVSKRKFGRNKIYEAKSAEGNLLFLYTFSHKLLLISKTPRLIEEALTQIEKSDREADRSLMPLLKTTNNQAQANLFVNHQLASEIFAPVLSEEMAIQTEKLSSYAAWTELDINDKRRQNFVERLYERQCTKQLFCHITTGARTWNLEN
jgi:23S rRNA A1618 N6-methylase RlmF